MLQRIHTARFTNLTRREFGQVLQHKGTGIQPLLLSNWREHIIQLHLRVYALARSHLDRACLHSACACLLAPQLSLFKHKRPIRPTFSGALITTPYLPEATRTERPQATPSYPKLPEVTLSPKPATLSYPNRKHHKKKPTVSCNGESHGLCRSTSRGPLCGFGAGSVLSFLGWYINPEADAPVGFVFVFVFWV